MQGWPIGITMLSSRSGHSALSWQFLKLNNFLKSADNCHDTTLDVSEHRPIINQHSSPM